MKDMFKNLKSFILSLLILFSLSNISYAQDLSNLTIGTFNFDDPSTLIPDSLPSNLPTISATFLALPEVAMATSPNSILSGSKSAFSISSENLLQNNQTFDNSITLIDSLGMSFTLKADVSNSLINFPNDPNTTFLFNTDTIPAQTSEGLGSIILKSNGSSIAVISVNILKSDILGTDSNDPRSPKLNFFKLKRHGNRIRLIIRGRNFESIDETTFSTIPSSTIKSLSIKTSKKGRSKIIVSFDINDINQSRLLFSINTPFGQLLEKVKLSDPAFRKKS